MIFPKGLARTVIKLENTSLEITKGRSYYIFKKYFILEVIMKGRIAKKIIMLAFICVLTMLDVFMVSKQIVQAEKDSEVNVDLTIQAALDKYINYNLSEDDTGTLVQYDVKFGLEYAEGQEEYQVKENIVTINLNQIDEKYPESVKVIAKTTQMAEDNYEYNSETGLLTIKQNYLDEYIIICSYDTYTTEKPERTLAFDTSVDVSLLNERKYGIK